MSRSTLTFLAIGLFGLICAMVFSTIGAPVQPPSPDRFRPAMVILGHLLSVLGAVGVVLSASWHSLWAPGLRTHQE